jgi:excisionase family DNA binding protein
MLSAATTSASGAAVSAKLAYSIPEAAEATGLSRSILYLALKAGKLIARKAGARTVIEDAELRRYLANLPLLGAAEHGD